MIMKRQTKQQLTEIARNILYSYKIGEHLSSEDQEWMISYVFRFHHNWVVKGKNIKSIYVDENMYHSRSFWIEYDNGKVDDISFLKCIREIPLDTLKNLSE